MQARFRGSKLHRKNAALARRNACQASVPRSRQDAEAEAGNRSPHRDRARKSDVGDGERQYFGGAGGHCAEFECRAADSAKHAEAGNGNPLVRQWDSRHWSLRSMCRHGFRSILGNTRRLKCSHFPGFTPPEQVLFAIL